MNLKNTIQMNIITVIIQITNNYCLLTKTKTKKRIEDKNKKENVGIILYRSNEITMYEFVKIIYRNLKKKKFVLCIDFLQKCW